MLFQSLKDRLFGFLFKPPSESQPFRIGNCLVLGAAYLVGLSCLVWLLNFGNVERRLVDWQKFYDFYSVIQNALAENTIPYFMPYFYKGTNQFLALPETDLTPTLFLLKYFSVEDFFLIQMTVVYSMGFIGCLWLRKTYHWSLVTFVFFFMVFNLNGHIISHLAIGHWPWISYFLFPFFIGWVFRLTEGETSSLHGVRLAGVLFVILLFGGLHTFVWCLLLLGLLCLFRKKFWKPVSLGVILAFAFSSYRIIPAAVTFYGYTNPFRFGFPSASVLWDALTSNDFKVDVFDWSFTITRELTWWEADHYIGLAGLAVILYFGIWSRFKKNQNDSPYRVLNIPLLIFAIFSLGNVYGWVSSLPIPLITVERASIRFLIVPILFLLALACMWMQQLFDRLRPSWSALGLALAVLFYEACSLIKHLSLWREYSLGFIPDPELIRQHDPISAWAKSVEEYYVPVVQVSYLISLMALLAFAAGFFYMKRKNREQQT